MFNLTKQQLFGLFPEFAGLRAPKDGLPHFGIVSGRAEEIKKERTQTLVYVRTAARRPTIVKLLDPSLRERALAGLRPDMPVRFLMQAGLSQGGPEALTIIGRHFEVPLDPRSVDRRIPVLWTLARVRFVNRSVKPRYSTEDVLLRIPIAVPKQPDKHEWALAHLRLGGADRLWQDQLHEGTEVPLKMSLVVHDSWPSASCLVSPTILTEFPLPILSPGREPAPIEVSDD
jgi:hypothetical protein